MLEWTEGFLKNGRAVQAHRVSQKHTEVKREHYAANCLTLSVFFLSVYLCLISKQLSHRITCFGPNTGPKCSPSLCNSPFNGLNMNCYFLKYTPLFFSCNNAQKRCSNTVNRRK